MRAASIMVAAVLAVLLATAVAPMADAAEQREADFAFDTASLKFTNTSTSALYVIWDFGDGTVLDGRWAHYEGATTGDAKRGYDAYAALLAEHGGDVNRPVHTYSEAGRYTVTITAINPLGYVNSAGRVYSAEDQFDYSSFDGGVLSDSKDKAVRGTWDERSYDIEITISEGTDVVPIAVVAVGALLLIAGLLTGRYILCIPGAVIVVVGVALFLGYLDLPIPEVRI